MEEINVVCGAEGKSRFLERREFLMKKGWGEIMRFSLENIDIREDIESLLMLGNIR